jgi:hypothetical protein
MKHSYHKLTRPQGKVSYIVQLDDEEENEPHVADYSDMTGVLLRQDKGRIVLRMSDGSRQSFERRNVQRLSLVQERE